MPKSKSSRPSSVAGLIRVIAYIQLIVGIALIPISFNNLDHPELIVAGVGALLGCPFLFAIAEVLIRLGEISSHTKNLANMQIANAMKHVP